MAIDFFQEATTQIGRSFANILLNGFDFEVSEEDKKSSVGITLQHFNPINDWSKKNSRIIDKSTSDRYCDDTESTVRRKCLSLFAASLVIEPIGLTLNLLNRIGKVATFAHLWVSSEEKYNFQARLTEWGLDLVRIVSTPLILIGMLFSSLYGASISPYDGRKLFSTLERFAYSGGYQFFSASYDRLLHNYLLAPCFQPNPKVHLGGGDINKSDAW